MLEKISKMLNNVSEEFDYANYSMFYGIIVRMFLIDNKHHSLPHIHAKYAEFEASIGIADWELAVGGENPYKIDPL